MNETIVARIDDYQQQSDPLPPGQVLQQTLDALGMSQAELAQRMGRPTKTINGIIKNKVSITVETALQLERVLGIPAKFWNNREQHYREALARQEEDILLRDQTEWLAKMPVAAMIEQGWLDRYADEVAQLRALLQFFGVVAPAQWQALWTGTDTGLLASAGLDDATTESVAAWLRRGELLAQQIQCRPFEAKLFRDDLIHLRSLTLNPTPFYSELSNRCARVGVAVVVVPPLPRLPLTGATRWLTPTKAILQLSAALSTDDRLWPAFYHQAGHLLLHGKRTLFLEGQTAQDRATEAEADTFAADLLIPPRLWAHFLEREDYRTKTAIRHFARRINIAPGLVVDRLQQERHLPDDYYNDLKQKIDWG